MVATITAHRPRELLSRRAQGIVEPAMVGEREHASRPACRPASQPLARNSGKRAERTGRSATSSSTRPWPSRACARRQRQLGPREAGDELARGRPAAARRGFHRVCARPPWPSKQVREIGKIFRQTPPHAVAGGRRVAPLADAVACRSPQASGGAQAAPACWALRPSGDR